MPETWMSAGGVIDGEAWFAVSIPSDLPLGNHTSTVRVDPRKLVAEANEGNNSCSVTWNRIGTVVPATDLEVSAVSVTPPSGPPDAPFKFLVTVRNAAGPTPGDFWVTCDRSTAVLKVSGLAPQQTRQLSFPIAPPFTPGSRTVTCTADESFKVLDRNQSNNRKSVTFTVTPQ
jgi:subtilase family serine protease